jgi:hypothetical protein
VEISTMGTAWPLQTKGMGEGSAETTFPLFEMFQVMMFSLCFSTLAFLITDSWKCREIFAKMPYPK